MAMEMQRIEEERRLRAQRDREYLDEKYRFLSMDNQKPDDGNVNSIRKSITGTWVDYHQRKPASSHHDKSPTQPRSVKSSIRRLDDIQIDKTSPRKVYQKLTGKNETVQCVVCDIQGDERIFVTCCLCNKRGHQECLETIVIGKDVLWICFICKTTIPPSSKAPQVNESTKIPTQRKLSQKLNLETTDHQIQHCGTCGKADHKPIRSCEVCDQRSHFSCMELAKIDNQIIWICSKCTGRTSEQITDVPPVIVEQPVNTANETRPTGASISSDIPIFGDMNDLRGITTNSTNRANLTSLQIASRHVIAKDLSYFSGNPKEWPIFISRFQNSTESCAFSHAENLDRLQRCLKGNALEAVRSRLNIPESVPDIIETLRLLYGRPELIINSMLRKIRQQIAPKADKLSTLVDYALAVKNLSATMEQTGLTEYSSNPALILELIEKLPTNFKVEWAKYKAGFGGKGITLTILGDWLYQLAEVISTVTEPTPQDDKASQDNKVQNKANSSDKKRKDDEWFNNPSRSNVHQQNYYSGNKSNAESNSTAIVSKSEGNCLICKKNCRNVEDCSTFKSLEAEQRWKAMVESKLCRKCLKRHSGICKSTKTCGVNGCSCKHHRLLHDQSKHSDFTKDPAATQSQHHAHINTIPNVFYRIVPVTLYNNDNVVRTLAYLDEGSDLTLLESQVAIKLNLSGNPERLCLLWTAKMHRFEERSTIVNLEISGQNEFTKKFKLLGVRTVEDLGLPEQTINRQMLLKKYPHAKGIPLIEYCGTPRILIGLANANLCTQIQSLEGSDFEPIVSQSRIGWSIHGPTRQPNEDSQNNVFQVRVCRKHEDEEIYHRLVKEHYTVENFGVQVNNNLCSKEEERAIKLLQSLTKRIDNGFETGLLFKSDFVELPDSYHMAKRRLICLEKQKPSKIQATQVEWFLSFHHAFPQNYLF